MTMMTMEWMDPIALNLNNSKCGLFFLRNFTDFMNGENQ